MLINFGGDGMQIFDLESGTWSMKDMLMGGSEGNWGHTSTLIPGNQLAMIGGDENKKGSIWLMDLNKDQSS